MSAHLAALPPGAILLHIGPYKTGSTAIQQSLFDQRDVLKEHGIHYPGGWRRLVRPAYSVLGRAPRGKELPPESVWEEFAARTRARRQTVCISTEDFGRLSDPDKARKIVEDLGADRVHVVAVARAYHRLLPSHWQERVKSTEELTYDEWLHQVFEGDASMNAHRSFWTSHAIEQMATQWLAVLPADRFTVVVSDDSDRLLLSHVFEQLLGLPEGLLAPTSNANASLSANAAEVLRRVNQAVAARGWSDGDYRELVRGGAARGMQVAGRAASDLAMPTLPTWVAPMVAERSHARIDAIQALGLRVAGDLECLLPPEQDPPDPAALAPTTLSVEAGAAGVIGVLDASLKRRPNARKTQVPPTPEQPVALARLGSRSLVRELGRRARRRLPGSR